MITHDTKLFVTIIKIIFSCQIIHFIRLEWIQLAKETSMLTQIGAVHFQSCISWFVLRLQIVQRVCMLPNALPIHRSPLVFLTTCPEQEWVV
jgi:hypothetical protein